MDQLVTALCVVAAVGCGLIGGVFFAFSSFVMGALGRLAPGEGMAAMQAINVVVLNRLFLGSFFATGLVCLVVSGVAVAVGRADTVLILVASTVYLLGVIGVTVACNVPRNERLAAVSREAPEATDVWRRYLVEWTTWNHVRTAAGLLACALFGVALSG